MTVPHKKLINWNIWLIVIGLPLLLFYYFIDGQIIRKPLHFTNGTNPAMMKVDKKVYQVGETPQLLTSFCKTRPSTGYIQWSLISGQITDYDKTGGKSLPVGCYPEGSGTIYSRAEKIPDYIEPTCDAHFVGVGTVIISGGRSVEYTYRTEDFCIEK